MRELYSMEFEKAKSLLESQGYEVIEVPNTEDDRHRYDRVLVVRVKLEGSKAYLTTAKFAFELE